MCALRKLDLSRADCRAYLIQCISLWAAHPAVDAIRLDHAIGGAVPPGRPDGRHPEADRPAHAALRGRGEPGGHPARRPVDPGASVAALIRADLDTTRGAATGGCGGGCGGGHHRPDDLLAISPRCFEQVRALYQALGTEYFFDFNYREAAVRRVAVDQLRRRHPAELARRGTGLPEPGPMPRPSAGRIAFLDNHDVDRFAMAVAYRMACLLEGVDELDWEVPAQREIIQGVQLSPAEYQEIALAGLGLLKEAAAQGASVLAYQGDEYPGCPHLRQSRLWLAAERTGGWGDLDFRQFMCRCGVPALDFSSSTAASASGGPEGRGDRIFFGCLCVGLRTYTPIWAYKKIRVADEAGRVVVW
ncbi:hypothetical protein PAPYR_4248 [Paratrimastix pyriformis]|uniref:Uncharacterized protein n=1 Tax=Paratrimastix pyriformis TaxID=342808 RepID=A0ABQ8USW9_9EUKA|nr:hypothetical protein PAPYR_4248 [Paratrimastix pyriformis]